MSVMPRRIGEPQRMSGFGQIPAWRVPLSEEPDAQWRLRFLERAHTSGLFHRSAISIESATLVFEIEAPALAQACEQIDEWIAEANGEMPRAQAPTQQATTILVVDDEPVTGPLVHDALEPGGYVVLHTVDPLEAIRMARHRPGPIHLLLTDVVMPLMDGRELARRILTLRPDMKILLMSGYEVSGLAETGWPFIAKPFRLAQLQEKVRDALEGRADPPSRLDRRP